MYNSDEEALISFYEDLADNYRALESFNYEDDDTEDEEEFEEISSDEDGSFNFHVKNTKLLKGSRYWEPVTTDSMGQYGIAEIIMANANFFNVGDVGDPEWMKQRELPFDDYESDLFNYTSSGSLFFGYETHPELQPTARDLEVQYMENDPAVQWALKEEATLLAIDLEDRTEADSTRINQLSAFINEARNYINRVTEDHLNRVNIPSWAMDAVYLNNEGLAEFDPEVMEEKEALGTLRSDVVSYVSHPTYQELKVYNDVYDDYIIESNVRESVVAIKDGVKVIGPLGHKYGKLNIYKSPNFESPKNMVAVRANNLSNLLMEAGFRFDGAPDADNLEYIYDTDIDTLMMNYNLLASEVNRIASLNRMIIDHYSHLEREESRFAFIEIAKKTRIRRGKTYLTVFQYLCNTFNVATPIHLDSKEIFSVLTEEEAGYIIEKINSKVKTNTYILQVKDSWGYQNVLVTKDSVIADEWKIAIPEDILYFLGTPEQRAEIGRPGECLPVSYGVMSNTERQPYLDEYNKRLNAWMEVSTLSKETLYGLVTKFKNGHKVKFIPSRMNRNHSWLMTQMPLNSEQIQIARSAISKLGSMIIGHLKTNPDNKILFSKLHIAMVTKIKEILKDPEENKDLINNLQSGEIDLHYDIKYLPMPNLKDKNFLLGTGHIHSMERDRDTFMVPNINFNYSCNNPLDVFRIVKSFKLSSKALDALAGE